MADLKFYPFEIQVLSSRITLKMQKMMVMMALIIIIVWKRSMNTEGFIRTKNWMPMNMLGTFCQDGIFARQHNLHEF